MLDAPHRQLVGVGRVAGVRRVALARFDGQPVFDLLELGVVQPDAEHVGVHQLVDPLVELAEDGLEVERGGDLAADVAEQLDVLLALALGPGQDLGGLGAQLGLGQLRPLALLADESPALESIEAEERQPEQRQVAGVGPPGAIPRRQDGERVGGVAAGDTGDIAGPDVELVVAEPQVGDVAPGLPRPRRPVVVEAVETGLVLRGGLVEKRRRGVLEAQSVFSGLQTR